MFEGEIKFRGHCLNTRRIFGDREWKMIMSLLLKKLMQCSCSGICEFLHFLANQEIARLLVCHDQQQVANLANHIRSFSILHNHFLIESRDHGKNFKLNTKRFWDSFGIRLIPLQFESFWPRIHSERKIGLDKYEFRLICIDWDWLFYGFVWNDSEWFKNRFPNSSKKL